MVVAIGLRSCCSKSLRVGPRAHPMSACFVAQAVAYLGAASGCTPEALQRLMQGTREDVLASLFPLEACLEAYRTPVQGLPPRPQGLFAVPDDGQFHLDLVGGEVLSAMELRARYHAALRSAGGRAVVWMVTNLYSHACHGLLHLERSGPMEPPGYRLRALFVADEELVRRDRARDRLCVHEILLLALATFADGKGRELRLPADAGLPLLRFCCALLGPRPGLPVARRPGSCYNRARGAPWCGRPWPSWRGARSCWTRRCGRSVGRWTNSGAR